MYISLNILKAKTKQNKTKQNHHLDGSHTLISILTCFIHVKRASHRELISIQWPYLTQATEDTVQYAPCKLQTKKFRSI
jgi:hypothetical protein